MPVSLLDIAPPEIQAKEIDIRGVKLRIQGIAAQDWAALYIRFPRLEQTVQGNLPNAEPLMDVKMRAAVIAAATGQIGNPKIEAAVHRNLTAPEATQIMLEAIELSLPGDVFGPLLAGAGQTVEPVAPEAMTTSPSPSTS